VSDPLARFARAPPHEGEIKYSPPREGEAAEGGRGSLTHHLESVLGNTPEGRGLMSTPMSRGAAEESVAAPNGRRPLLHSFAANAAKPGCVKAVTDRR
jgi:hypothetical protein